MRQGSLCLFPRFSPLAAKRTSARKIRASRRKLRKLGNPPIWPTYPPAAHLLSNILMLIRRQLEVHRPSSLQKQNTTHDSQPPRANWQTNVFCLQKIVFPAEGCTFLQKMWLSRGTLQETATSCKRVSGLKNLEAPAYFHKIVSRGDRNLHLQTLSFLVPLATKSLPNYFKQGPILYCNC